MQLLTMANDRLGGNTPMKAIENICPGTARRSIHVLDDGLGNSNGSFTTPGRNFSYTARGICLSSGVLRAELRTVAGHWKADSIALHSRCNYDTTGCTHELVLGAPGEVAAGQTVHESIFDLGYRCQDIRLEGASRLRARCLFESPFDFQVSTTSLDSVLGNSNGSFCFGNNFSASARNVHLNDTTLFAELSTVSGEWHAREVELRRFVCNVGRGLESLGTQQSLEV